MQDSRRRPVFVEHGRGFERGGCDEVKNSRSPTGPNYLLRMLSTKTERRIGVPATVRMPGSMGSIGCGGFGQRRFKPRWTMRVLSALAEPMTYYRGSYYYRTAPWVSTVHYRHLYILHKTSSSGMDIGQVIQFATRFRALGTQAPRAVCFQPAWFSPIDVFVFSA